jgi:hypothetical protein
MLLFSDVFNPAYSGNSSARAAEKMPNAVRQMDCHEKFILEVV